MDAQDSVRQGYLDNRPRTTFFNYAVSDTSGQTVTFYLGGQLSSTDLEYTKQSDEIKGPPKAIEVATITMNDLLAREGVTRIDFLSMDIEDGEPAALAGFDIGNTRPASSASKRTTPCGTPSPSTSPITATSASRNTLEHDYVNWYFRPKKP